MDAGGSRTGRRLGVAIAVLAGVVALSRCTCNGADLSRDTFVCQNDSDCAAGHVCENGTCQAPGAIEDAGAADAGATDAATEDAGVPDAGGSDAGLADASASDGGAPDGAADGAILDSGFVDAGASDGGTEDGGPNDGGAEDGGSIDGGPIDAGASDAGVLDSGPDGGSPDGGAVDSGADAGFLDAGSPDACTPLTSCQSPANCGVVPDGCGGNVSCGPACPGNQVCGGGGLPNVCGTVSVIQKVFIIVMENEDSSDVYGPDAGAPYINNTLMTTYAYATKYQNVVHPSQPNYIWLEAGSNACGDFTFTTDTDPSGTYSTATLQHLVTFLTHAGRSWKSYQEGATAGTCPITAAGSYTAYDDPFPYFQDISGSPPSAVNSFCASHVVPLTQLATDLANNAIPDYVFITPDHCHDMHDCGVTAGDTWLQSTASIQLLIAYAANPANHAILIVAWDESSSTGILPMLLVAPPATLTAPGTGNATALSHSSYVKSLQLIFQVDPSHYDPTTGQPYPWLRTAGNFGVNDFSSFFAAGQFP